MLCFAIPVWIEILVFYAMDIDFLEKYRYMFI